MVCDSSSSSSLLPNKARVRASRAKVRRTVKEASLLKWVRGARKRGLTGREIVHDLHVRRELPLPKVARLLKLSLRVVRGYWRQYCAKRARTARAANEGFTILPPELTPQPGAGCAALRAHISLALWETVAATFAVPEVEDGAGAKRRDVRRARLMSVRIRALKQIGKLHGVGGKRRSFAKEAGVRVRGER